MALRERLCCGFAAVMAIRVVALVPARIDRWAALLQAMFPNCSHEACNDYPVCSGTQGFCNESVPEISKWPLCVNGLSKSVARVEALEDLSLHVHDLKPGTWSECLAL